MDKFTKQDLTQCENLVKALKRAKFELDGMEVLAFAETMKWVNSVYNRIVSDLKDVPKPSITPVETEAPKPVEPPKQSEPAKKVRR